ncbi:50S ribosomal protein L10 [Clostridia bacterium]|nr:50S ribosomal protein L10 [Clostridia bacterium]
MAKVNTKQSIVDEIKELLKEAKAVVLADYRGLTVGEDTALRKSLRESKVSYKVYKNTLLKLAIQGTEFESLSDDLSGPTAIAVAQEDISAPARILHDFAKQNENLSLKSGMIDGVHYDQDQIKKIATIPSREVLLSKLLGSLQSPIANLARVLDQIAKAKEA